MIHVAPNTTSTITSKSISKGGGRTSYRGHIKMYPGANNSKSFVKCDALLLDDESRSDTYPYNDVDAENVTPRPRGDREQGVRRSSSST